MGEVYRARDMRLDRTVAVKILPEQFSTDALRKQRFEREAKAISGLNHPNICVLHEVGSQNGVDYLSLRLATFSTRASVASHHHQPITAILYTSRMTTAASAVQTDSV